MNGKYVATYLRISNQKTTGILDKLGTDLQCSLGFVGQCFGGSKTCCSLHTNAPTIELIEVMKFFDNFQGETLEHIV